MRRKRFKNQSPDFLAIVAATMVLLAPGVRSQEIPAAPVTTIPADQSKVGEGGLAKVTVTGYIIPRIGTVPNR